MKQFIFSILLSCTFLLSCNLNELPKDTTTESNVINTEEGLKTYANSFYKMLPTADNIYEGDNMSDIVAVTNVDDFIKKGIYSANVSSGWDWSNLRNINEFLEIINKSTLDPVIVNNYRGIARFFRAYFYFEKVKRFGDVPWYGKALSAGDPALFNPRDSRALIMDSVLTDINYAIEHISSENDITCTQITQSVALAYKSRICLFEGTFRKYHLETKLQGTSDFWLTEAMKASKELMDRGKYRIFTDKGVDASYRTLFTSVTPVSSEIILAFVCDAKLNVYSAANRRFISPTFGARASLTHSFINTYMKRDGSLFTNLPNYKTTTFSDEVKDRDCRLKQTIRLGDYKRTSNGTVEVAAPNLATTYTGYQTIKWCYDEKMPYDDESLNDNAISMMRYAEVLLNYAEAKAELGTITTEDWVLTIGALRARAGITGASLSSLPSTPDSYMQALYPSTNAILLEIRRERAIELVFEGLRFYDLIRWNAGNLLNRDYDGMYVPALNTPMDLNEDGIYDVCFYHTDVAPVFPKTPTYSQMVLMKVEDPNDTKARSYLSEGDHGNLIRFSGDKDFQQRNYLYPIPQSDIDVNQSLTQNTGW